MVDARGEPAPGSDLIREVPGYRIDRQLGRGSTGVVYLAEDVRLRRKVALKVLAPTLVDGELFGKRFDRESHNAANLDHPNIIPVYAAGEAAGALYIAMRYVSGGDLRGLVEAGGPLGLKQASAIIGAIADALDAVHAHGMVHRDVKPANILIDSRNGKEHYYLSDFGISKIASMGGSLTSTGQIVGTIDYIAPEQVQAKPVDGRADLYALGCVLYHCLTGAVPFPREDIAALIWAHVQETPPLVTAQRPDLPPHVDHIVAKAMAKRPEDRYSTCRELALALHALAADPATSDSGAKAFSASLTSAASPPGLASMTSTYAALTPAPARAPVTTAPPGRRWWWLAAGGVVALALIAGSTVAVLNYRSSSLPHEAQRAAAKLTIPEPTQAPSLSFTPAPEIRSSAPEASGLPQRPPEAPEAPRSAPGVVATGPVLKAQDPPPQQAQTPNAPVVPPSNPISTPTTDSSHTSTPSTPSAPSTELELDSPTPLRPGWRQEGQPEPGRGGCGIDRRTGVYYCTITHAAPLYLPEMTKPDVSNSNNPLRAREYPFLCQSRGPKYSAENGATHWWAWVEGSRGTGEWVPVMFLAGWQEDAPEQGLPVCGSSPATTTSPTATTTSQPTGP